MDEDFNQSGPAGNKVIIVILVAGLVLLIAAIVMFLSGSASDSSSQANGKKVEDVFEPPAPLVMSDSIELIQAKKTDGETDSETSSETVVSNAQKKKPKEKMGKIDPAAVSKFINARFGQVRKCYERRLKISPALEGVVDLRISLSSDGWVTGISVNRDGMRDAPMIKCMRKTIKKWHFPAPIGGRADFDKPFQFKKSM